MKNVGTSDTPATPQGRYTGQLLIVKEVEEQFTIPQAASSVVNEAVQAVVKVNQILEEVSPALKLG